MKVLLIDQIVKVNYKYTFPLANALVKQGLDVHLIIDQKKEKENCQCNITRLFNTDEKKVGKIKKLSNYISSYMQIEKIIKKEDINVVHSEWYTFSPIDFYFLNRFKRKYNIKYVATVHDILPFNEKFYDKFYHEKLYSIADNIILQAPENIKRFKKLFPQSVFKVEMIPHGHMLDYVEIVDKDLAREKLNLPKDKIVFLFFGQIKKVKGVDILLKAVAKLKDKYTDFYTVIAGSVWKADFTECNEIIKENNLENYVKTDIRYIPDDEVKYYYSAADICVLPYTDVYQSGVIQLSYGYKKAVIATSLPAFTQFVKENETGFLAEPGDVDSLVSAMENAINNNLNLENIGCSGYEKVKRELDWDEIAKKINDRCYNNMIKVKEL